MHSDETAYACQAAAVDRPILASIGDAADTAGKVANMVQAFIDRCRGGGSPAGATTGAPVPTGHFANLERLQENLKRLESLTGDLSEIG